MEQKNAKKQAIADRRRPVQNFLLVWLDTSITSSNKDSQNTLQQLRSVVNDITLFTDPDECVTFIQGVQTEKAFIITSGSLGQALVPCVHPMAQVTAIFIFCGDQRRHEQWAKAWPKIKGVHTEIEPIRTALQLVARECNQDSIAMSFVQVGTDGVSNTDLDRLDPSFMYTQLFKNALLDMQHDEEAVQYLVRYCKDKFDDNPVQLELIEEFGRKYSPEKAIWWYTRDGFTHEMLNRALRLLEADILVNMGFFMHDLHRQIQQLHQKQVNEYGTKPFIVYRGQGMSTIDFEKLQKTRGGLISFNSFVSTSKKKKTSLDFARRTMMNTGMVGLLFIITINPKVKSTPFANIQKESFFAVEDEILFSMHSVFRIDNIESTVSGNQLFEVRLTLTNDEDPHLRILTDRFRDENRGSTGLNRIGNLLIQVGEMDKAEELYRSLLEQPSTQAHVALYYNQLGIVKNRQGQYTEAVGFYEKALDIFEKTVPANQPDLATSYNNIGSVYANMGEYSKALSFHEKALDIDQKTLPANHPNLATSYNNIGSVYDNMGEYSKALSFHEKALDIDQKTLPANHALLATSYNNIGLVYDNMGKYLKALSFYEKALDIYQKTLPANHHHLLSVRKSVESLRRKLTKK
jgi:Tfp pilus assembly protein PilF